VQDPPKFTQIGIFGSKRNHLATLIETQVPVLRLLADTQITDSQIVDRVSETIEFTSPPVTWVR
jgi:hypothetical protein